MIYRLWRRASIGAAVAVGLLVVSHWVLDAISHRPDMPLTFANTTHVGLGLWYSIETTVVVEVLMLAVGLWLYLQTTRPRDWIGSVGLWALVGFLVIIYIANIVGPPPPSSRAVAWTVQAVWLLVIWAFWVDRHREPVQS